MLSAVNMSLISTVPVILCAAQSRSPRGTENIGTTGRAGIRPRIYKAEDVQAITSRGRITTPDGWEVIVPKPDAVPVC